MGVTVYKEYFKELLFSYNMALKEARASLKIIKIIPGCYLTPLIALYPPLLHMH